MTKKTPHDPAMPPTTPPSATGPVFIIETSLLDIVVPRLNTWLDDLTNAIPRVMGQKDEEAIHDLRVALRRIRSLLRILYPVLGRFHVKTIRDEFKRVGDATGALRDEEVLVETIEALDLGEKDRNLLGPWMARRAEQEQILRQSAIRMLESGCLDAPIEHLRALLLLPLPPKRDKEAHRFARKAVLKAQRQVEVLCTEDVGDVSGMHNLRIAFKRLRYAVEALGPALPLELRVWEQVGARFQKILGNLHDQDVAMDTLRASKDLSDELRDVVLDALKRKREVYAQQYLARAKTMIGCELPPGEGLEKDSQS